MNVLADSTEIGSTRLATRVGVGGAMIIASALILHSGTSAWTTVDNVTFSGSDLHGPATTALGVVLVVASLLIVVDRLTTAACVTAALSWPLSLSRQFDCCAVADVACSRSEAAPYSSAAVAAQRDHAAVAGVWHRGRLHFILIA